MRKICSVVMTAALIISGTTVGGFGEPAAEAAGTLTELSTAQVEDLYQQYFADKEYQRVSVHDPSIVIGYIDEAAYTGTEHVYGVQNAANTRKEVYFIFGSHQAFAYSTDLKNWTNFENNINRAGSEEYKTIFSEGFAWSAKGDSVYNPTGNMWAPDVIWDADYANTDGSKGAWLMYMSINGCSWNSSIALLTAESLNGDWTYQDTVVYSGFTADGTYSYAGTDYAEVTGDTSLPARYTRDAYNCKDGVTPCEATTWNNRYGAHAIDPCVLYDGQDMWMTYGSWSGGIWMFKLDAGTGLRDKQTTYTYQVNESDPYTGYMLAGGNSVSGEASYIQKINGKYYLFVSYGGLVAAGGYNIRVFSSDNITGPYKDLQGHDARQALTAKAGDINGTVGNRLMTYYKWDFMDNGFVAEGHNSAFVDDDGKAYVVYHSRFSNRGEVHEVRVHQLFTAKNGGLVTAPFEYSGETLSSAAYSNDKVVGEYNIVTMRGTDYAKVECATEEKLQLNADGTVSGAYTGTWSQETDGPYVTLTANGVTYQGVLIEQNMEGTAYPVMGISLIGTNDISVWGYKTEGYGADAVIAYNVHKLAVDVPEKLFAGNKLDLTTKGYFGAEYTWSSSDTSVISDDGVAQSVAADTNATIRLTISKGDYKYVKDYTIQVLSDTSKEALLPIKSNAVLAGYSNVAQANEAAPEKNITAATGLSISMYAPKMNDDWVCVLQNITKSYMLQFATISYSENNAWCWYYENAATLSDYAKQQGYDSGSIWSAFKDGSAGAYYLTISFNTDGSISYYRDGHLMMTYGAALAPSNGSVATSISKIAQKVISDYKAGNLEFTYNLSNIVVGYAVDFDATDYVPVSYDKYTYYADYDNAGMPTDWKSANGEVTSASDTEHGIYTKLNTTGSGNRGAILDFDSKVAALTDYTVEVETALTGGLQNNRSVSDFMITSAGSSVKNSTNDKIDSDYIFRMTTPTYLSSDASTRTTWYINDDTSKTVAIPAGAWIRIKIYVKTATKEVTVSITDIASNSVLYQGTEAVKGDSAVLKGLYTLLGRTGGSTSVDKIKVYQGANDPYSEAAASPRPSASPSSAPTVSPSVSPSSAPTVSPSASPSSTPTVSPSVSPSSAPTVSPSASPSSAPTVSPSTSPSSVPAVSPSASPSSVPTASPAVQPGTNVTPAPARTPIPSVAPTPTKTPIPADTPKPTQKPETTKEPQPTATTEVISDDKTGTVITIVTDSKPDGTVLQKTITANTTGSSMVITENTNKGSNAVIYTGASDVSGGKKAIVNIPAGYLELMKAEKLNQLDISIEKVTVDDAKKGNASNISVEVIVPPSGEVAVGKLVVTKEAAATALETKKALVLDITDGSHTLFAFTIPTGQLKKMTEDTELSIVTKKIGEVAGDEQKDIKQVLSACKVKTANAYVLSTVSNGEKIGMTAEKLVLSSVKQGDIVYVYRYNAKTGKLEEVANYQKTVSKEKTIVAEVYSGIDYVVTNKKLSGKKVKTLFDDVKVKVLNTKLEKGKSTKINVDLGNILVARASLGKSVPFAKQAAKITYSVSNKKISVSKKGIIKTKKKGTAVITVKIQLKNDRVKKIKKRVVVK